MRNKNASAPTNEKNLLTNRKLVCVNTMAIIDQQIKGIQAYNTNKAAGQFPSPAIINKQNTLIKLAAKMNIFNNAVFLFFIFSIWSNSGQRPIITLP